MVFNEKKHDFSKIVVSSLVLGIWGLDARSSQNEEPALFGTIGR